MRAARRPLRKKDVGGFGGADMVGLRYVGWSGMQTEKVELDRGD